MSAEKQPSVRDHDGVFWSRSEDGKILWWDEEDEVWHRWQGQEGPQPPRRWVARWKATSDVEEPQQVEHDGALWTRFEDGRTYRWDDEEQDWYVWNGEEGPQPPPDWSQGLVPEMAMEARRARQAGLAIFQVVLPISATRNGAAGPQPMWFAPTETPAGSRQHVGVLDAIEREGWTLAHAGYVFQPTGSKGRDRPVATGQVETIAGDLIGIYVFRATEDL
jgi:hypothetical protein